MRAEDAILKRRTVKVLTDTPLATGAEHEEQTLLEELLALAHNAPFHYPCAKAHQNELDSIVPWRAYNLTSANCRKLAQNLKTNGINGGKITQMLDSAKCLMLFYWLPDNSDTNESTALFEPTLKNMEHIAAASAAIQNVLIGATAKGFGNYWSSGGVIKEDHITKTLKIPTNQILLGAVFIFESDNPDTKQVPGALADKRSSPENWSSFIKL